LNGETDSYCPDIDPLLPEGSEESVIVPFPSPDPSPLPIEYPAGHQYQGRIPPGDILSELGQEGGRGRDSKGADFPGRIRRRFYRGISGKGLRHPSIECEIFLLHPGEADGKSRERGSYLPVERFRVRLFRLGDVSQERGRRGGEGLEIVQ